MVKVEAQQGTWIFTDNILKGQIDADLRAYCLAGAESDEDYIVRSVVKMVSGTKASLIAFFSYDKDWNERYVECILDVANSKLQIDLINGAERQTVASRDYVLSADSEYDVSVTAKKAEDGSGYVLFALNDVVQLRIEDLAAMYTAGMYGFACEGAEATDYSLFSKICFESQSNLASLKDVKDVLQIAERDYDQEIVDCAVGAGADVVKRLSAAGLSVASPVPRSITDIVAFFAAWMFRRRRDPAGAEAFRAEGEKLLETYIEAESDVPFKVGQA